MSPPGPHKTKRWLQVGAQALPVTVPSGSAQSELADARLQVSPRWGLDGTSDVLAF